MLPPAPSVLSISTGWPRGFLMRSPMMRARVSVGPPAENGTKIVTGLDGYVCAVPMLGATRAASTGMTYSRFMFSSSVAGYDYCDASRCRARTLLFHFDELELHAVAPFQEAQ